MSSTYQPVRCSIHYVVEAVCWVAEMPSRWIEQAKLKAIPVTSYLFTANITCRYPIHPIPSRFNENWALRPNCPPQKEDSLAPGPNCLEPIIPLLAYGAASILDDAFCFSILLSQLANCSNQGCSSQRSLPGEQWESSSGAPWPHLLSTPASGSSYSEDQVFIFCLLMTSGRCETGKGGCWSRTLLPQPGHRQVGGSLLDTCLHF